MRTSDQTHCAFRQMRNLPNAPYIDTLFKILIELKQQLSKIHNSSLTTTHTARNLGFIFDEHLTFFDQISALSKSCYYHNRELRRIQTTHSSKYPHCLPCLRQSYTHRMQRPPTVSNTYSVADHYVGPPTATSNMLRNIWSDTTLTSLPGPPTHAEWQDQWCILHTWTSIFQQWQVILHVIH